MSTVIRPELSKKNRWYISKHRYYELKHFCLQYPEWKENCKDGVIYPQNFPGVKIEKTEWCDPTMLSVDIRSESIKNIKLVENAAMIASDELYDYILASVTQGYSFTYLQMVMNIPCGKDMFFDRYRKFFYVLSMYKS